MKSKLIAPKKKTDSAEIKYPVLARLKCKVSPHNRPIGNDKIVLFTDVKHGMCIWARNENSLGDNPTGGWIPVTDKYNWEILPKGEKVELSN